MVGNGLRAARTRRRARDAALAVAVAGLAGALALVTIAAGLAAAAGLVSAGLEAWAALLTVVAGTALVGLALGSGPHVSRRRRVALTRALAAPIAGESPGAPAMPDTVIPGRHPSRDPLPPAGVPPHLPAEHWPESEDDGADRAALPALR